jgi:hypothetical protein
MTVVRRFVVLLAILFWQGGFTFYAAVVVHVGSEVLGSHVEQGFVTRSVTNYLNLAGVVALALWGWDIARTRDSAVYQRRLRWACWTLLVVMLGLLRWLHVRLDELLDSFRILDQARFGELHRWYLHISTVQWADSLLLIFLTLQAWRAEDTVGRGSVSVLSAENRKVDDGSASPTFSNV